MSKAWVHEAELETFLQIYVERPIWILGSGQIYGGGNLFRASVKELNYKLQS